MTNGNGTTEGFQIGRPTFVLDGEERPELAQGLASLLVAENIAGLYRCEALFSNWGPVDRRVSFLYFDRRILEFGKTLVIKLGRDTIFEGRITGLEARFPQGRPPEIVALAEDRFQDLRMTRRTRTFADVSDADIFRTIAGEHGLTPSLSLDGPTHKVLAQVNQSDLAFLRERARAVDGELWVEGRTLNARSHTSRNGGTQQLSYGSDLREFTVLADLSGQYTSVTIGGWDVSGKRGLASEATDSVISGELNGLSSGASVLRSAFGPRKESLAHTVPLTQQEAQAAADTFFRLSARRFVVGQGLAQASARLRVGNHVDIQNLGPLFNGKYYLSEVRHLFDGHLGIRTEFTAERPGLGSAG